MDEIAETFNTVVTLGVVGLFSVNVLLLLVLWRILRRFVSAPCAALIALEGAVGIETLLLGYILGDLDDPLFFEAFLAVTPIILLASFVALAFRWISHRPE